MKKYTHRELVLHAVLLVRTINKNMTKERDIELYDKLTDEELMDYIEHFNDPTPEYDYEEEEPEMMDEHEYTSCTRGDYSPSNPWDAPGMSISDFI